MDWRSSGDVELECRCGVIPLMWFFKERIFEGVAVRQWFIIILVMNPPMPLGGHSITIGASHWQIVIVFDPSSLIIIYPQKINYAWHRSTRNTCCRTHPCPRTWRVSYFHRRCVRSWLPYVRVDMFGCIRRIWVISRSEGWTYVPLTMATNPKYESLFTIFCRLLLL